MSERGVRLLATADGQISGLIGLLSVRGEAVLSVRCPGRERLGDGTAAAVALLTADRYQLIAGFLQAITQTPGAHAGAGQAGHRTPRLPLARGHAPRGHAGSGHEEGTHDIGYTAENVDLHGLLEHLSGAREALSLLADLTDQQLDTAPAAGSFRFCDGKRTLEQVVASLLKHQSRQIDAIRAAVQV